ncbi:hypothetical protein WME75_26320 [Sorangium sp. So ce1014]|uniref:hypothetical protein n=1 Tax=Sorangium sp. So ce1014 TaxID=3133326 RepID=UPI003F61D19A
MLQQGARFDVVFDLFTTAALLRHFHNVGHVQALCTITDLGMRDGEVFATTLPFEPTLLDGRKIEVPNSAEELSLADFDAMFLRVDPPISEAYRHALILLSIVEQQGGPVFVNSPSTILTQGSKILVSRLVPWVPPTLITGSPQRAREFAATRPWVVKPVDRASGVDVVRGAAGKEGELDRIAAHYGFLLAQEYQPLVESEGEMRHLVFADNVISAYRKQPAAGDFRANADCGATELRVDGDPAPHVLQVIDRLRRVAPGIAFCSLDFVGSRLIEINFENPGGLPAADRLYGRSHAAIIEALLRRRVAASKRTEGRS